MLWILVLTHSVQSTLDCSEICSSDLSSADSCPLSKDNCALCLQGCQSYQEGLSQGCENVCNNTAVHEPFFESKKTSLCSLGCQGGIQAFLTQLQESREVQPPRLISNSLGSRELKLIWQPWKNSLNQDLEPQTILLQIKVWTKSSTWQTLYQIHPGNENPSIVLTDLEPFTRYQFRVALSFSDHFPLIFSPPTPLIQTEPEGLPSAPSIVQVSEANNRLVSISWNPPEHPRNILSFYRLHISHTDDLVSDSRYSSISFPNLQHIFLF